MFVKPRNSDNQPPINPSSSSKGKEEGKNTPTAKKASDAKTEKVMKQNELAHSSQASSSSKKVTYNKNQALNSEYRARVREVLLKGDLDELNTFLLFHPIESWILKEAESIHKRIKSNNLSEEEQENFERILDRLYDASKFSSSLSDVHENTNLSPVNSLVDIQNQFTSFLEKLEISEDKKDDISNLKILKRFISKLSKLEPELRKNILVIIYIFDHEGLSKLVNKENFEEWQYELAWDMHRIALKSPLVSLEQIDNSAKNKDFLGQLYTEKQGNMTEGVTLNEDEENLFEVLTEVKPLIQDIVRSLHAVEIQDKDDQKFILNAIFSHAALTNDQKNILFTLLKQKGWKLPEAYQIDSPLPLNAKPVAGSFGMPEKTEIVAWLNSHFYDPVESAIIAQDFAMVRGIIDLFPNFLPKDTTKRREIYNTLFCYHVYSGWDLRPILLKLKQLWPDAKTWKPQAIKLQLIDDMQPEARWKKKNKT